MPGVSPAISVILCTWNDEKYISEAIESILNQTLTDLELIIVNDGSTDQTGKICLAYKDARIRYFEHKENKGQEEAKNLGLSKAKGKYIAYMDGDDLSRPQRLAQQFEYLESHPQIGICSTNITFFEQRNEHFYGPEKDEHIRVKALYSTPMTHATCMIRRDILQKHQITYEKGYEAAEDFIFIINILCHTKAHCLQEFLYLYRWHGGNISITKSSEQWASLTKTSRWAFKHLLGLEISEEDRVLTEKMMHLDKTIDLAQINRLVAVMQQFENNCHAGESAFVNVFRKRANEAIFKYYNYQLPNG